MKHWIQAFRLRTLPLAVSSIAMGSFLAASQGRFDALVAGLCVLTAIALQILSNLANDYGDSVHGADHAERQGPSRTVQSGKISMKQIKTAIIIAALLSLISGISLLVVSEISTQVFLVFIVLGLLSLMAAFYYTNGKIPYGYQGFGDISVFIFFGLLGVLGSYYLQTGQLTPDLFLPGTACGLLTVAVLNVNNIRDIESDKKAGKLSIPVRLGRRKAVWYHIALLLVGLLCGLAYVLINYEQPRQFVFLVILPMLIVNAHAVYTKMDAKDLDPYLKQMAITNLLFVGTFGFSIL